MTDTPAWINTALRAAEDAIRQVPLTVSGTTRETRNGLRNADEVAWEAMRAFIEKVPLADREGLVYDCANIEDAETLRHLKNTFTEQSDA